MQVIEPGKGRRVRCPICNAMFVIESNQDYVLKEGYGDIYYAELPCPDCGVQLRMDLTIEPKQDVFVAGRV